MKSGLGIILLPISTIVSRPVAERSALRSPADRLDSRACGIANPLMRNIKGDGAKVVVIHQLDCALILGQCIVENDFFLADPFFFATPVCGVDVPGRSDQFLEDLCCCDGIAVVAGDCFLQPLGEGPVCTTLTRLRDGSSPLMSLCSASNARFFFSIP